MVPCKLDHIGRAHEYDLDIANVRKHESASIEIARASYRTRFEVVGGMICFAERLLQSRFGRHAGIHCVEKGRVKMGREQISHFRPSVAVIDSTKDGMVMLDQDMAILHRTSWPLDGGCVTSGDQDHVSLELAFVALMICPAGRSMCGTNPR
jgi:hypothetical protein